ncbi:beta-1,3-galactosyltransferase 5-like [Haliotis rufescens]|uniref:beta-1,3-galactosyltransferase 5-like n=1 Tax=Haliotis rufescens TaxID=6454 RepID=UPI00201F5619|nr:beta-1,3-galactosyltransferase 5-like [Haliotis rufescens]
MRVTLRRCATAGVSCVAAVVLLSVIYSSRHTYYGDERLLPYEDYFLPSSTEKIFLEYDFLINSDVCSKSKGPFLLVMVLSTPEMTSQRDAIRDTWGSIARGGVWPGFKERMDVRMVFLFGNNTLHFNEALKREALSNRDIVQASFTDSYTNLTLKVLMGYRWVEKHCPDAKFVMKMDEDVFVNIPYILSQLYSSDWSRHILGPLSYSEFTIRDGKYGVSESSYHPPIYPPHVKGNLYVMQTDVAVRLLHTAPYMTYVNMEDAFITGILAKVHRLRHVDIPETLYDRNVPATFCDIANRVKVVSQQYTAKMMYGVWEKVKDSSPCSLFGRIRHFFRRVFKS